MASEATNESTRREWRELGFYYDRNDELQQWRILGTQTGLLEFARHIREYAADPSNRQISEHIHLGPYWYLEIGTSHTPEITDHWIAGPIEALSALANEIEVRLATVELPTVINLRAAFAPESPYELTLEVQPEGFDPALADGALR